MIFLRFALVALVLFGFGRGESPCAGPLTRPAGDLSPRGEETKSAGITRVYYGKDKEPLPSPPRGSAGDTRARYRLLPARLAGISEPTDDLFKNAFKAGNYPWYDANADRVRPVWPVRISWLEWLNERVDRFLRSLWKFFDKFKFGRMRGPSLAGNSVGTMLLLVALTAFLTYLFLLWLRRERRSGRTQTATPGSGRAARLGDIPDELWPAHSDPWAEANRRRAAGDLAGAIVCLFAHQLFSLDQMGLIRLAPGRTGRHYLQALRDREVIDCVGATLALFEEVYYGRRPPTAQAFESVWNRAQWFEERSRTARAGAAP